MIPREVYDQALRDVLAPVACYLDDASVSEVLINGPSEVFVERRGRLVRVPARFDSVDTLLSAVRLIAQYAGRSPTASAPIVEARLPDGSRVEAVLPPAAPSGPCVAIRRFSRDVLTVERLIAARALTSVAARALQLLVVHKQNVIVAGGTGSGKTSMLNALASFVPDDERVVVIEDATELQLQGSHVVQLEAQGSELGGAARTTVGDLFRATLRLRPDRIVVGEIRGAEAIDLIQAMTSGHGGCMSTLHASHPIDTLQRLETMALTAGLGLPLPALRAQIASAVDVIVQVARHRDGRRCVTDIAEVSLCRDTGSYLLTSLFEVRGGLEATGVLPRCVAAVHAAGERFPSEMYGAEDAR